MAISLYRRYRPDTFEKVIGQGHIVKTLVNQINSGNVSHAYLFTGTRGTGKTTVARIFSKAINCLDSVDGSPCGKCKCCLELQNPNNMDIIEIDAASNSTVDEIRDLREKVKYPPIIGKYKVFIIDEVHMLSTSAFNALLKTLEEPPSHVVFILATTDVHKLPQTILSRCMRFDFKLLTVEELSQNLKNIFDDLGKKYEDEAVNLIANAGEGSARDSLSIADMCLAYSDTDKVLTYKDVLDVLGASDPNIIIKLVKAIVNRDVGSALPVVNDLVKYGKNIQVIAKDIASYVRDVLYIKNCADAKNILKLPSDIFNALLAIAKIAENSQLLLIIDLFNNINTELRYSTQPRIILEATIARACTEISDNELLARVRRLEMQLSKAKTVIKKSNITNNINGQKKTVIAEQKPLTPEKLWVECHKTLARENYYALGIPMANYKRVIKKDDGLLEVVFAKKSDYSLLTNSENLKVIEVKLSQLAGKSVRVLFSCDDKIEEENNDVIDKLKNVLGEDTLKIIK